MSDVSTAPDNPRKEPDGKGTGYYFYETVTRRDRAPGEYDRAHEQIALKLEELGSSIYSKAPPQLAALMQPFQTLVDSATFATLASEALGILRQRSPETYDDLIAGLVLWDDRQTPFLRSLCKAAHVHASDFQAMTQAHVVPLADRPLKRAFPRSMSLSAMAGLLVGLIIGGSISLATLSTCGSPPRTPFPARPMHFEPPPLPEFSYPRATIPAAPPRPAN